MLVSDVIYKLPIVLRCPGWSIQRTYIMDLLACASYVVAQILKLLFNRFGNCFILIIQSITLVDQLVLGLKLEAHIFEHGVLQVAQSLPNLRHALLNL